MARHGTRRIAAIGGTIAALLCGLVLAEPVGVDTLLGSPAPPDGPTNKTVRIDANTRWVNVVQDDIVKFVVSGPAGEKTFAWHFATRLPAVDLGRIAPAGTIDRLIYVYVAPNPRYSCG